MAQQDTDGMISIDGRCWCFPGDQIAPDSEFEWRDGKVYLHDGVGNVVEGIEVSDVALPILPQMNEYPCCFWHCLEEGVIHIGFNGGDSHWICWRHYIWWSETRARLLADGGPCEMEQREGDPRKG